MRAIGSAALVVVVLAGAGGASTAENVDPAGSGQQYAWAENVGWINAEPSGDGGPGLQVFDFELTGWMWGENLGWISLSCKNTASCATTDYGVTHDGQGNLGGFAWSENGGWIAFAPAAGGGVTIDPSSGLFKGEAWGENIGWISFNSAGANPFELLTSWQCDPELEPPAVAPLITLDRSGNDILVTWTAGPAASAVDLVIGSLDTLRASGGDFSLAANECRSDDQPDPTYRVVNGVLSQGGDWYLVRPVNCNAAGSHDSGGPGQVDPRDAGIAASGASCP